MFDFNKWVVDNLISGVLNGRFSKEWAAVQLANYYVRGKISDEDIARFEQATAVQESKPVEDMAEEIPEITGSEE